MARVFGQLFDDGRDGVLVLKPSAHFFGADRDERHFDVINGSIDIELSPTPPGIYYNVGFQKHGDLRDPVYTLKWQVPRTATEIDISPKVAALPDSQSGSTPDTNSEVQIRRLAHELAAESNGRRSLEEKLSFAEQRVLELEEKIIRLEKATEVALSVRDAELAALRQAHMPETRTIYVDVPVPPKPLKERISFLEAEVTRLMALNDSYYTAVLELNQLKLERAQTINLPQNVEEVPDTPRQRLIQKLTAK
jgi:hypothetical protein